MIPGWVEALQLMHVGEKIKLYIPSELAYGAQSPSPAIPANSVLVFDMELLGIKDPSSRTRSPRPVPQRSPKPRRTRRSNSSAAMHETPVHDGAFSCGFG